MENRTDDERPPAPGELALVQEFMNASGVDPEPAELRVASGIRKARENGDAQATLAAQFGVSRQLVSAIIRGKRLVEGDVPGQDAQSYGSPKSAKAWLVARCFLTPADTVNEEDVSRLQELRELLIAMGLANNGQPPAPRMYERLDGLARDYPLQVRFGDSGAPSLAPVGRGVDAFIARAIAIVYEAMNAATWPRLKVCYADRCHAAFYDTSKNRTAQWCSMSICGNRAKVRSYQQRRRAAPC